MRPQRESRRRVARAGCIALPLVLALLTTAAGPAAARARHGCTIRAKVTPAPCYPKSLTGTFSGRNEEFTWTGTVALKGRREQTVYAYTGKITVEWHLRSTTTGSGCTRAPDHGTFTERASVALNRTPDRRRGWSYSGGDLAQGSVGNIDTTCYGETNSDPETISGVFDCGGFSRDLRTFAGAEGPAGARTRAWSLHGH